MSRPVVRPLVLVLASTLLVPALAAPASAGKATSKSGSGAAALKSPVLTDPLGRKMR